jgi:hypothetical protein
VPSGKSAISISALRELLAQDLLGALGEIRFTVEQADEGEVPHRLIGQQRLRLWGLVLAGAGLPDAGAQQLLGDSAQGTHLVRIESVHHPMQAGMDRTHRHRPRIPSAREA